MSIVSNQEMAETSTQRSPERFQVFHSAEDYEWDESKVTETAWQWSKKRKWV